MASKKYPDRILGAGEYYAYHTTISKDYPCHWHNFYEFEYIRSGEYIHIVNGRRRLLGKGDLVFCTSSDIHSIEVTDKAYVSTIQFEEKHLTDTSKRIINSLKSRNFTFNDKDAKQVRDSIFQLHDLKDETQPLRLDNIRNRIETVLLYCAAADGNTEIKTGGLIGAVGYIDSNFREPITLEKAANLAGLSKGAFSAVFRKKIGVTFQDYIIKKRLNWASTLLKSTELNITEIAYNSGFRSHSHFSSMFKKVFGISPLDYRDKHRKNPNKEIEG